MNGKDKADNLYSNTDDVETHSDEEMKDSNHFNN